MSTSFLNLCFFKDFCNKHVLLLNQKKLMFRIYSHPSTFGPWSRKLFQSNLLSTNRHKGLNLSLLECWCQVAVLQPNLLCGPSLANCLHILRQLLADSLSLRMVIVCSSGQHLWRKQASSRTCYLQPPLQIEKSDFFGKYSVFA